MIMADSVPLDSRFLVYLPEDKVACESAPARHQLPEEGEREGLG